MVQATCRQAISLGLDVSSSVDQSEYTLQLEGVVAALNAPVVIDILFLQPDAPVRIHVFEWSGPVNQTIIVPWTTLNTPADLATVTARLRGHQRGVPAPTTAVGSALLAGFAYLEQHPECWIRTLDLSGDGETNTGPLPEDIPLTQTPAGVTVNGLVVGSGNFFGDQISQNALADLEVYYRENVIRGPVAFVEVAKNYDDYAAAMERKLLRELSALAVGQIETPNGSDG
ncbi:lipoprotein, putative [Roseobacter sp. CCS2]|nr:lipoprotein, putative [Roseobacter sp. CCS2]